MESCRRICQPPESRSGVLREASGPEAETGGHLGTGPGRPCFCFHGREDGAAGAKVACWAR